ncbi:hypothetical protein SCP_0402070 [Sparassis crispa]|uniref:Uncharacterized protein n=1 Tax=Sparassis crispa TaxID=139825 RepID=A0A401GI04_9APHY|nr:hypothetical protein SCP_0402070 [Sparassis crispa]GBE81834.1 hypothetical protein SCP_0402070 [Sparassis crispa]
MDYRLAPREPRWGQLLPELVAAAARPSPSRVRAVPYRAAPRSTLPSYLTCISPGAPFRHTTAPHPFLPFPLPVSHSHVHHDPSRPFHLFAVTPRITHSVLSVHVLRSVYPTTLSLSRTRRFLTSCGAPSPVRCAAQAIDDGETMVYSVCPPRLAACGHRVCTVYSRHEQ